MSETTNPRRPTMPDVVAAGIHWATAQAEFNAAANTLDEDRLDRALDAYDAASEAFKAVIFAFAEQRMKFDGGCRGAAGGSGMTDTERENAELRRGIAAYRAKRAADGHGGRVWDAITHGLAEKDVTEWEARQMIDRPPPTADDEAWCAEMVEGARPSAGKQG